MSRGQYVQRSSDDCWQARVVKAKKLERPVNLRDVGARFRIARKQAGLTQVALTQLTGLAQSTVSRFEKGERGVETDDFTRLLDAAAKSGVNLDFVFSGDGSPLKRPSVVLDLGADELEDLLRRRRIEKERK